MRSWRDRAAGHTVVGAVVVALLAATVACAPWGVAASAKAPDPPFRTSPRRGPVLHGLGQAIVVFDGVAYVGGSFDRIREADGSPRYRNNVVAIDIRTGDVLSDFRADTNGVVRALATDGKRLYIGGAFSRVNGRAAQHIAAVDLASGDDIGFRASTNADVNGLAVADGRLYVAGWFDTLNGRDRSGIAAVQSLTGAVVKGWAPQPNDVTFAVAVSTDGATVYLGGQFEEVDGEGRSYLAAVDAADGTVQDVVFDDVDDVVLALDTTPNRVVAGVGGRGNMVGAWRAGSGQQIWGEWVDGDVQAVAVARGVVWFGFHDGMVSGDDLKLLGASLADGDLVDWWPSFDRYKGVFGIAPSARGLVVTGRFDTVNGVTSGGYALFPKI